MKITAIRTTGLGDATYLLAHDGAGVIVDPQRDVARFEQALSDAGVEATHVLETHLHNDYISGGRELAARTGANLVFPAAGGVAFAHVPAFHNEDLNGGPFTVRPLHTPGHTPEHMSYLVLIEDEPAAVFSGGSLLVGSAGRSDLLGPDRAEQLARLQYISVNRLAALPDDVGLYPTHGEGSFCTSVVAGRSTSTIGLEKLSNPVLQYADADAFVAGQLSALEPYPSYYAHMGPINLMGPEPLPGLELPELDPRTLPAGAAFVDVRPRAAYAAGHIPGSVGLEMSDRVGVWAGWLLPFDATVVLVAERGQDVVEVATQFARIGFDHVAGVVFNLERWVAANGDLASFETRTADELFEALQQPSPPQVLDVRAPGDWEIGHLDGSIHGYTPDLKAALPVDLDSDRDVWIVCASGFRALAAATYVEQGGFRPVVVTKGGVPDILHRAATEAAD
jgi:glyoxylase-like metal-dependent hydrolase (beta-lactamase superfamily II)/rhodanese-related sulfurtransferase